MARMGCVSALCLLCVVSIVAALPGARVPPDVAGYEFVRLDGVVEARNVAHGLRVSFDGEGVLVAPAAEDGAEWEWRLRLTGWGRRDEIRSIAPAAVSGGADRVERTRGGLTEWYENGPAGLKQGFTLAAVPEGEGAVVLEMAVSGMFLGQKNSAGGVAFFQPPHPLPVLAYGSLAVFDAEGREIPANLDWSGSDLRIVIEDAGAAYPLLVDPLVTSGSWASTETDDSYGASWGDVDQDGDLDLAVANWGQQNRVYLNNGGALETTASWSSTESDSSTGLSWGDVDGDGDLDLAVSNWGQKNRVYINTGGSLEASASWSSARSEATAAVAWGDVDGDGSLDLAVGNFGPRDRVHLNMGTALEVTASWASTESSDTYAVDFGDADGDGALDLAAGDFGAANRIYMNLGNSLETTASWTSTESDDTCSLAWGDVDGDGDLDLAVGNAMGVNRLYLNAGSALETTASWASTESDNSYGLAWGDWDGDGDLDLAAGNGGGFNRVYVNSGTSLGATASWSSTEADATNCALWGDVDGDGDLDLAAANQGANRLYANSGNVLSSAGITPETDDSMAVAWGDWDGDGDLDLAVGNNGANRVYENTGGTLLSIWTSTDTRNTLAVAWGDADGDGDLDLCAGNYGTPDALYLNTGGSFTHAWDSPAGHDTLDVAWGDWDGDGDLDLAAGHFGGPNIVYENDGAGSLAEAWSTAAADDTRAVAWGDWDNDGDLDLAEGNYNQPTLVYENTGGNLAQAWSGASGPTTSVAWGDWNGDGFLDLAEGHYSLQNYLWQNTGSSLSMAWTSGSSSATFEVVWGDWDGDGDLDLAEGNYGEANLLYENTGTTLSLAWTSSDTDSTTGLAWGDLDGDGDLDLASADASQANRFYANGVHLLPGGMPETPTLPAALDRPGSTDAAFFFSSEELLVSPVTVSYTLYDGQGDRCRTMVPEFSLRGGGQWLPATEGAGGDGTTDLSASPAGEGHTFIWDAAADGADSDSAVFRITVLYQTPEFEGQHIQRPAVSAVTPPFKVGPDMDGDGVRDATDNCPEDYNPGQLMTASIGDRVWLDADGDGLQGGGETGVEGVYVHLYDDDLTYVDTAVTGAGGGYAFTDLCPGGYVLHIPPPLGYSWTLQDQGGDDGLDSDIDPGSHTIAVTLAEAEAADRYDAGLLAGCAGPDEPVWIYQVTLSDPEEYPILHFQDPNQPSEVTGYNIYRSDDPGLPMATWPMVASNVVDMDAGTANIQWTDQSGDPGDWCYQVTAFHSGCDVEGPF